MRNKKHTTGFLALLALVMITACGIVSGTFVIDYLFKDIDFTATDALYRYVVNLGDNETWADHEDQLESVDVIGFEMWIVNHDSATDTFRVYIDNYVDMTSPMYDTEAELIAASVPRILGNLAVAPGLNTVTYAQSLLLLENTAWLKEQAASGNFVFYGVSASGSAANYTIDSVRVILTITASEGS